MKTKKIFALLLSALLCLSMIPFAAFAANPTTLPDGEEYAFVSMMTNPEYIISNGQSGSDDNGMKLDQEATTALNENFTELFTTAEGIMFRINTTAAAEAETYFTMWWHFTCTIDGATVTSSICTDVYRAAALSSAKASYVGMDSVWYLTTDNGETWTENGYAYEDATTNLTAHKVAEGLIDAYVYIPFDQMLCKADLNGDGTPDSYADVIAYDDFTITKMSGAANRNAMKEDGAYATDFVFVTEPTITPAAPATLPVTSMPTSCTASAVYMTKNPEYRVSNGSGADGGFDENSAKLEKKNTVCMTDDFNDNFRAADGILLKFDNTQTVATDLMMFAIDFEIQAKTAVDADGNPIKTKLASNVTRAVAHGGTAKTLIAEGTTSTWYMTLDNGATWTPVVDTYNEAHRSSTGLNCMAVTAEKVSGYLYIPFDAMLCKDDLDGDGDADTYADLIATLGEDYVVNYLYVGANKPTMKENAAFLTSFMFVTEGAAHTMDAGVETTAPTHTEFGVKTYTCSTCNAKLGETVDKTPEHDYTYTYIPEDADNHTAVCECGDTTTEAHDWDEGVITTQPTVDAEGVKTYTCVCGEAKTEAVPQLEGSGNNGGDTTTTTTPAPAAAEEEDGGCGSVISTGAGMMIALAGAAMLLKKKRK